MSRATVPDRLRAWLQELAGPPATPEDEAAYQREEGLRAWPLLLAVIFIDAVAGWVSDPFVFSDDPHAPAVFAYGRLLMVAGSLALLFAAPRLRSHAVAVMVAGCAVLFAIAGAVYGHLDPAADRWFLYACVYPLASIVGTQRMSQRVGVTLLFTAAVVTGFFAPHPELLRAPYVPRHLEFIADVAGVSILGGASINALRRRAFLLQRIAARQADEVRRLNAELASWNQSLQQRVDEQTAQLRRLTSRLEAARETERTRIARELHDELGQELTGLRLVTSIARSRFTRDPSCLAPNLETIASLVDNATTITRQIVRDLRPRALDDLGLTAAVEWLVRKAHERGTGRCTLHLPAGDLRPPGPVADAAFRIVQESLTNVAKHARATETDVELRVDEAQLVLVVTDNGVGLPEGAGTTEGVGLIGMRERARALEGEVRVTRRPQGGTRIEVRLPLPAEGQEVAS